MLSLFEDMKTYMTEKACNGVNYGLYLAIEGMMGLRSCYGRSDCNFTIGKQKMRRNF